MSDIAVAIMLRDEVAHFSKTFESVAEHIDTFVVLDTGSLDGTQEKVKEWCCAREKTLIFEQVPFKNFAESRNVLLKVAERAQEPWLLLLDASDELRGDWKEMYGAATKDSSFDGFLLTQKWLNGADITSFKSLRLIRNRSQWHYRGAVHEYLYREAGAAIECLEGLHIFQDRNNDGGKTSARLHRDYALLSKSLCGADRARNLFYLARTCEALGRPDEAIDVYQEYLRAPPDFPEEVYCARMNLAANLVSLGLYEVALREYWRAHTILGRFEPLLEIAEYYYSQKDYEQAYRYVQSACVLDVTDSELLFVEEKKRARRFELLKLCEAQLTQRNNLHLAF